MVEPQAPSRAYPCLQHSSAHISHEDRPPFPVDHFPGEVEQVVKQRGCPVSPEIRPVLFVEAARVLYHGVTSNTAITVPSASLPQSRLELFTGDIAQFGDHLTIDFDGGELQAEEPLDNNRVGLLDDLNVERILFFEFCDHRTYVLSYPAWRIVEVKSEQHVHLPERFPRGPCSAFI